MSPSNALFFLTLANNLLACLWFVRTHTHTHLTALCPGLPKVSRYQKGKTYLDFTEARDSEWQWHGLCRSSIIRMSNMSKQDVLTKTIEDERIQIGVLKASVDETEEPSLSDDEESAAASDESEKSGDKQKFKIFIYQKLQTGLCIF